MEWQVGRYWLIVERFPGSRRVEVACRWGSWRFDIGPVGFWFGWELSDA